MGKECDALMSNTRRSAVTSAVGYVIVLVLAMLLVQVAPILFWKIVDKWPGDRWTIIHLACEWGLSQFILGLCLGALVVLVRLRKPLLGTSLLVPVALGILIVTGQFSIMVSHDLGQSWQVEHDKHVSLALSGAAGGAAAAILGIWLRKRVRAQPHRAD